MASDPSRTSLGGAPRRRASAADGAGGAAPGETLFAWSAVDAEGRRRRGRDWAARPDALARLLGERGLTLVRAEPGGEAAAGLSLGRLTRRRDVLEATRALATLLGAGLPLARALATAALVAGPDVRAALLDVRGRVERGDSLTAALGRHPALFSALYRGVVLTGERSGELPAAMARLAAQLERDETLRARLLSASLYPILLAVVGGAAIVLLVFFALPRFAELLGSTGAPLPRSTAIVLAVSGALRRAWPVLATVAVGAMGVAGLYGNTDAGRRVAARILLALPLVGQLRREALASRFAQITGTLGGGGGSLLRALDGALDALGDPVARDEVARVRARVREGSSLHGALAEGSLFPELLAQLVAVGEDAGRLPDLLLEAAALFADRTERRLQHLVALAEPAMIVLFGGIVALVALSLLQAIYGVNATVVR